MLVDRGDQSGVAAHALEGGVAHRVHQPAQRRSRPSLLEDHQLSLKHLPRSAALPAPRRAGRRSSPPASSRPPPTRSRSRGTTAAAAAVGVVVLEACAAASSSTTRSAGPATPAQARLGVAVEQRRSSRRRRSRRAPGSARRTSATARLSPLAPVGGTMWAASPARKSRPYCIGSATKLRIGGDALLDDRPVGEREAGHGLQPGPQLVPDALVGPVVELGVRRDLQVEAADRRASACCAGRSRARVRRRSAPPTTAATSARMPSQANG